MKILGDGMKKLKGAITIEASLLIPIIILAMITVLYLTKIVYVHERIQFAITGVADEMSSSAYIIEKAELLEFQQDIYKIANENSEDFSSTIQSIEENYKSMYQSISSVNEMNFDSIQVKAFESDFSPKGGSFLDGIKNTAIQLVILEEELEGLISASYSAASNMFADCKKILANIDGYLFSFGGKEGLHIINNIVGGAIARGGLKNYVSDEECKRWGIVEGIEGISFVGSDFMLSRDDVMIVANYKVKYPFLGKFIGEIPIKQSVRVRGFVGNGNFKEKYRKVEKEEKKKEKMVYVTKNGKVYHTNPDCYHVKDHIKAVTYGSVKEKKEICEICCKDAIVLGDNTIVYTTNKSSKFHLSKECYTISTRAYAIAYTQAIEKGLRKCKGNDCKEDEGSSE